MLPAGGRRGGQSRPAGSALSRLPDALYRYGGRRASLRTGAGLALVMLVVLATPARGQHEQRFVHGSTLAPADTVFTPEPREALWRALAVPGWGQYYNRQYLKIPFVWAGLGAMGAYMAYSYNEYSLFDRAYTYRAYEELNRSPNPFTQYQSSYQEVLDRFGVDQISSNQLEPIRNDHWRNVMLSTFGMAGVYLLSALDAYVNAHLANFDIDEDLELRLHPRRVGATLRLAL